MATMQLYIIAAALALDLVAFRAADAPLAIQQASTSSSPAMLQALFRCRRQQRIDWICATALTQALVIEQRKHEAIATTERACHAEQRTFPQGPGTRS